MLKKRSVRSLLLAAVLMAAPSIADATVYFVLQGGSGSGATVSTPMSPASFNSKTSPTFGSGDIAVIENSATMTTPLTVTTSNYTQGTYPFTIIGAGSGATESALSTGTVDCISFTNVDNVVVENLQLTCTTPPLLTINPTGAVACLFFDNTTNTTLSNYSILGCQMTGAFDGFDFQCNPTSGSRMQNLIIRGNVCNGDSEFGGYTEEALQGDAYSHFSDVLVFGNVFENISGDDNGANTANGNGCVLSAVDDAVPVLKYAPSQFGGSSWGGLFELNFCYNNGFDSMGGAGPAALLGENSSLAFIGNLILKQYASASNADGEGIATGNSGPDLILYNAVFDTQGAGIAFQFDTAGGGKGARGVSYCDDNLVVNYGSGYVSSGTWVYSVTAGSTNNVYETAEEGSGIGAVPPEASGTPIELPNKVICVGNTVIGNPNVYDPACFPFGGGWYVNNNVFSTYGPALRFCTTSGQAPSEVVGNWYNASTRLIYNSDTNTTYTLAGFQALTGTTYTGPGSVTETYGDMEKVGSTTYGGSGATGIGCPLTNAAESIYPVSAFAIVFNSAFAPGGQSALIGGGISSTLIATLTGVEPPTTDLNNRLFNGDIGAIGSGKLIPTSNGIPQVYGGH